MSDWKYRPDIDGLRAVAVVLVLLFHGKLGFQGGFVGVDVFFVISGFVITGLFLKEHHAREFCLYDLRLAILSFSQTIIRNWHFPRSRFKPFLLTIFFSRIPVIFQAMGSSSRYYIPGRLRLKSSSIWFTLWY